MAATRAGRQSCGGSDRSNKLHNRTIWFEFTVGNAQAASLCSLSTPSSSNERSRPLAKTAIANVHLDADGRSGLVDECAAEQPLTAENGFRLRGDRHVSRIESFSDAVFAFSMTLLVVSLQVPRSFDDLLQTLAGFPAFALSFALLALIWVTQNRFFRRYGLQDGTTIFLNLILLFVIVFFTYPLKFLFTFALNGNEVIRDDQVALMYAVYALGFASIFAIFFVLHMHALRNRKALALTPWEVRTTYRAMVLAVFQITVAATSAGAAAFFASHGAYGKAASYGGLAYLAIPIGITLIVVLFDRTKVGEKAVAPVDTPAPLAPTG